MWPIEGVDFLKFGCIFMTTSLFRHLRKGEHWQSNHWSEVSVTCIVHVTHVVSTKPCPPATSPEWLVAWLLGGFLSSGVFVWVIVAVCTNLKSDLYMRLFYSLILHNWLQRTCVDGRL